MIWKKKRMDDLELYVPKLEDLWFRRKMMADPETMSYNANWDVDYDGYHRESGCIDFPASAWAGWYENWVDNEPERFYAYIRRAADGAWLGEVSFRYVPEKDWWDMGIVLHAPYRGLGYSVPALRLMLDHAFRDCGVSRLYNEFEVTRPRALPVHLAVGFREMPVRGGMRRLMLTREEFNSG